MRRGGEDSLSRLLFEDHSRLGVVRQVEARRMKEETDQRRRTMTNTCGKLAPRLRPQNGSSQALAGKPAKDLGLAKEHPLNGSHIRTP